jgi:hypothetical protein
LKLTEDWNLDFLWFFIFFVIKSFNMTRERWPSNPLTYFF